MGVKIENMSRKELRFGLLSGILLFGGMFSDGLWSQESSGEPFLGWHFKPDFYVEGRFRPLAGSFAAQVVGSPEFSRAQPSALNLSESIRLKIGDRPENLDLPREQVTLEAWLRVSEPSPWAGVFSALQDNGNFERGLFLGTDAEGRRFNFAVATESRNRLHYLLDAEPFVMGAWYCLTATYDGRAQRLYVDGRLAAEADMQLGPIRYAESGPIVLGRYEDDNEQHFLQAELESVFIWKRALSASEVASRFEKRRSEFPGIVPEQVEEPVEGWPTYLRDNRRSGITQEEVSSVLSVRWIYRSRKPPTPSWPPPARHDPFNKKFNLEARVVYDRAFHLVAQKGRVYFGSSSEDKVVCLDLESGKEHWTFYAEGPVRNAPSLHGNRLFFGSDDGFVYALRPTDGLQLWKTRIGPKDFRLPGNSRLISMWPIRTGVTAWESFGFVCAGLFPRERVINAILNLETGEILRTQDLNEAVQGYMQDVGGGQLRVPTGRSPVGANVGFLKRELKEKRLPGTKTVVYENYPYTVIGTEEIRFGGGDGRIAAWNAGSGEELWKMPVEGKAWSMALCDGYLLVSTDQGLVYCLSSSEVDTPNVIHPQQIADDQASSARDRETALKLLEWAGTDKGYAWIADAKTGGLALELSKNSQMQVICTTADEEQANRLRRFFDLQGKSGQIAVHHLEKPAAAPYNKYLFNLICYEEFARGREYSGDPQLFHDFVKPHGGVFVFGLDKSHRFYQTPPKNTGEWTHPLGDAGNSGCSGDKTLSTDLVMQWYGPPGPRRMVDRHQKNVAPLFKDGRVYISGRDFVSVVDAYNGTILWEQPVPDSFRAAQNCNSGNMAVGDDAFFMAAGDQCLVFERDTGEILSRFPIPDVGMDWGYLALGERFVIGSATPVGGMRWQITPDSWQIAYGDNGVLICSQSLFAYNPDNKEKVWHYSTEGVIANPCIALGDGRIFFLENPSVATRRFKDGRVPLKAFFQEGKIFLVALDVESGNKVYARPLNLSSYEHVAYMSYAEDRILLTGSKYKDTDGLKRLYYEMRGLEASTGEQKWSMDHFGARQVVGGIHGEQTDRPAIVNGKVHLDVRTYDLQTGREIAAWQKRSVGGCGVMSTSADWAFRRMGTPTMINLKNGDAIPLTQSTRPGCWINIIPAGGLVIIPEASSGCSCNHAIQTSLVLRAE